ncbi:ADP-ribose pyrophosphatase YjhB (NUDIX family) [Clostridium tetanomorphum]|uniref:NUDIX hydrolase n=1 Tax=Clostridium tetanomorphum TaxID=1553 RepID=A0A923J0F1_CLOTT
MLKRDTRVQVVILKEDKYILLKHYSVKEDKYFWALPGGGKEKGESEEEGAIREVFEETGLKIKLLPWKFEIEAMDKRFYNRMVTFIGYPIEGQVKVGYDPEEDMCQYYRLVDIKWQHLYDDEYLSDSTLKCIQQVRRVLKNNLHIIE